MKNIKFLILILLVFFINSYHVNATDYKCSYKNGNQTIALNVSVTGDMDYPINYSISINGTSFIKFYPADFINYSNGEYERFGGAYYIKGDYWKPACPQSLDVVWKDNNYLYKNVKFSYNNITAEYDYPKIPIIFFSDTGYEIINNKIDKNSVLNLENFKIMDSLNRNDSEYKNNLKNFTLNEEDSSNIEVIQPPTEDEIGKLQYCYYKNECGAVIELKFYKNGNINERVFNNGQKLMNWTEKKVCPTAINFQDSKYYGQGSSCAGSGSVINCYNFISSSENKQTNLITDGNCKNVADDANAFAIRYVSSQNGKASYIKIIEKNGKLEASLVKGSSVKTLTNLQYGSYESIFLSQNKDKYPMYLNCMENIEKVNSGMSAASCTFSSTAIKGAAKTYIDVSQISTIVGLGDPEIMKTCKEILGSKFVEFLKENVFKIVYIIVPIILILLTSFDFAKVVFIDDKDGINKSFKRFGKRCIVAILIYLIPTMIIFITNIFQADEVASCAKVFRETAENIE